MVSPASTPRPREYGISSERPVGSCVNMLPLYQQQFYETEAAG
jgi:hypothetical protein